MQALWLSASAAIIISTASFYAEAKTPRSTAAKSAFKKAQPCPATGEPRGACPAWIIDHITPLCAGGADSPENMQWQTVEAAKDKDREEKRLCALLRKNAL